MKKKNVAGYRNKLKSQKRGRLTETCKSRHGGLDTVKPRDLNRDQYRGSVSIRQNTMNNVRFWSKQCQKK
jgi:hypothetical protein